MTNPFDLKAALLRWLRSRRPDCGAVLTLSGDRTYLAVSPGTVALIALTGHPGSFVSGVNGAARHP